MNILAAIIDLLVRVHERYNTAHPNKPEQTERSAEAEPLANRHIYKDDHNVT